MNLTFKEYQASKVSISRDEHPPPFPRGPSQNLLIARSREAEVTGSHHIVTKVEQEADRDLVNVLIGEQSHPLLHVDLFLTEHCQSISHAGPNVLLCEVWIKIGNDALDGDPCGDEFEDVFHGDAGSGDHRLSETDLRIYNDSGHGTSGMGHKEVTE